MKLAHKIMEMIEESAHDIHNIADFLSNSLEHMESDKESVKHMQDEFGLSDDQANAVLSWWGKLGPKGQLKLSMDARKMTSELEKELLRKK